jgi:hypothetical protein
MKTNVYFWSYLAQFILKCDNKYQRKVVEEIKAHNLCSIFLKS